MNILLVIADLGLGGAQQVVINLANELVRQGHCVWIYDVYPELRKEGMIQKIDSDVHLIDPEFEKIQFHQKVLNSFLYRTGLNKNYIDSVRKKNHRKALDKILNENKIDTVNSHVFWADEFVLNELRNHHDRWFVTLHGSYLELLNNHKKEFISQIERIFLKSRECIFLSVNEIRILQKLIKLDTDKFTQILNGIPCAKSTEQSEVVNNKFKVLVGSRAIVEKGWRETIEAIIELNSRGFEISLDIAGDGPMLNHFMQEYDSPEINFLGFVSNLSERINAYDLVLLPSYFDGEALPTILLEALHQGKPIISTDIGECKLIVGDSEPAGKLIPLKSGPELTNEIVDVLEGYLKNDELYKQHAFNALKRAKRFTAERMAKDYINLFIH